MALTPRKLCDQAADEIDDWIGFHRPRRGLVCQTLERPAFSPPAALLATGQVLRHRPHPCGSRPNGASVGEVLPVADDRLLHMVLVDERIVGRPGSDVELGDAVVGLADGQLPPGR